VAWSVHAGVALEKKGIPTVTIVSHLFQPLAQTTCRNLKTPSHPMVVVPHPVGGISPDEAKAKADGIIDELVFLLSEQRG
jgi:hypothetical protein